MAIQTMVRSRWNDPGDASEGRWEWDWNDASMRVIRLRSVNPTSVRTAMRVTSTSNPGVSATLIAEPQSGTVETGIPASVAADFGVTLTATGHVAGVKVEVFVPAGPEFQAGTTGF